MNRARFRTRRICLDALQRSQLVVVAGDLNDTPASAPIQALTAGTNMQDVMTHAAYEGKPGTYTTGNSVNQKIDYVFLSPALWANVQRVDVERRGVYAPNTHASFPEVTSATTQASDHGAMGGSVVKAEAQPAMGSARQRGKPAHGTT